ncbi:MAG: hypothetical protein R3E39_12435 [Anaerolineae bacterium]
MQFMTREVFDTLIIIVIVIGLVAAARRLRQDFTRPLPVRLTRTYATNPPYPPYTVN